MKWDNGLWVWEKNWIWLEGSKRYKWNEEKGPEPGSTEGGDSGGALYLE